MKIKLSIIWILASLFALECTAQKKTSKLICTEYQDYMLTHQLTPVGPIPTAFDPNGVYPYMSYAETSNRPVYVLENSSDCVANLSCTK